MRRRLDIGSNKLSREFEMLGFILVLLFILIFSVYFGLNFSSFNLDNRNQAAGRTIFLENGGDLQAAIDNAEPSDAIFLKPGSYTPSSGQGFIIRNKSIRILGAGKDFTSISSRSGDFVFKIYNSKVSFESVTITGSKGDGIKIDNAPFSELNIRDSYITNNSGSGVSTEAKTFIQTSVLDQNGDGITSSNDLTVENTYIKNSAGTGISILANPNSETKIINSLITTNASTGISIEGGKNVLIKNATLFDNGSGIEETGTNTSTTIVNTIVQKSRGDGISLKGTNSTVKYSNSYQNRTNYSPASLASAEGNLSVDSGFISNTQFQLSSNSQVKNKGVPTETNSDGSRIDMGAFGGSPILIAANGIPVIKSSPPQYVRPGQEYLYEIIAEDPDSDALSYVVLNDNIPRWLKQDRNKLRGTPSQSDVGYYGVMVVVSDRKGGNVVHPISINVLPQGRSIPEERPKEPTSTPLPTSTPVPNQVPQITILSPTASSVFSKNFNTISWSITPQDNIDSITIKYSSDGKNFVVITKLPGTVTSYNWTDVNKLTNGKYFIRIEATDKGNPPVTVGSTSQQFEVNNPEEQNTDIITITKINPADNDVVQSRRQVIVVEFQPESDLDKTQTKLLINGKEVAYDTTRKTIFHQPNTDYEGNTVQVEVRLVTVNGAKASRQWSFNIQSITQPNDTTPTTSVRESICFPGSQNLCVPNTIGLAFIGCLVLILLLLILYFTVKFIKTIRDQREGNLEAEFTEYYGDGSVVSQQIPDVNQSPQNQENQQFQNLDQYYSVEQQPIAEQPQLEQQQIDDQSQLLNPGQYQEQAGQPYQVNQYTQEDQSPLTQSYQPNTLQSNQNNDDNLTYSNQDQNSQGIDQGGNLSRQNETSYSPNETSPSDQYIQELKSKYGITDEAIDQYKRNQASDTSNFGQNQDSKNPV